MIAFDGRFINENISGIGRYSLGLLEGISNLKPNYKINVLIEQKKYIPEKIYNCSCFNFIEVGFNIRSLKNQIQLPNLLKRNNIKTYHVPDSFAPVIPIKSKLILTIHDMIPIRCYKELKKTKKVIFLKIWKNWQKLQCKRASAIITVSNHSKNDINNLINVPNNKIHVIYNGVEKYKGTNEATITSKFGHLKNIILYVGRFDPYKNIISLVEAFNILKNKIDASLIIVGALDSRYPDSIKRVKQLGLQQKVFFTGQLNDSQLASIFSISSLFAFPSLYEGFGLPPLEAMAYGVPVISSNKTSLPEILGKAALFIDPTQPKLMADSILHVLKNTKLKNNLITSGLERAKMFTWTKSAEEHLKIYESII